jgi:hypothetical protein
VALTVLASTALHGLTSYPFARRYGEHAAAMEEGQAEHKKVPELPVRIGHSPTPTPTPTPAERIS